MALSKSKTDFEVTIAKAVGKKIKYCRENYYRSVKEIVDGEFKGTYKPVKMLVTQSRLAKFCGVTFQQIQKYEKGGNSCSLPKLLMIAAFFQKPITYFLEDINLEELLGQDTSPNNNPIAPSLKEYGITEKSKCH
jgi:DNA-binding XRE family transcriptional regulator